MAEFTDHEKREIVTKLASFVTPSKIVAEFAEQGIDTSCSRISKYDATKTYYEAGANLKALFEEVRKRYIEDLAAIPAASRAFRVNLLYEAAMEARAEGKRGTMANLLRQIAEETGGALTNERKLILERGLGDMSDDERRQMFARLVDQSRPPDPQLGGPETRQ